MTSRSILEASNATRELRVDVPVAALAIDALGSYEETATACAGAMTSEGPGMSDAVLAALNSVDLAQAARRLLARPFIGDSKVTNLAIEATVAAMERSAELCGQHAHHHEHCRLHAESARSTIEACQDVLSHMR